MEFLKVQGDNIDFLCDCIEYISKKNNINLEKANLLDFGCGAPNSNLLKRLYQRNICKNLFGLDVFPSQKSNNNPDKYINIKYVKPYEEFPFKEKFDVIIANQVFEHIDKLEIIYSQISEKLKENGFIIAGFPTKEIILEPHIKLPLFHRLKKNSFLYNLYLKIASKFNLGSFSQYKNDKNKKKQYKEFRKVYMNESVHYRYFKEHYKLLKVFFNSVEDISDLYCKYSRDKKSKISFLKKFLSVIYPKDLRLWLIHKVFGVYVIIKN